MKVVNALLLIFVLVIGSGCSATYTGVQQIDHLNQNFFVSDHSQFFEDHNQFEGGDLLYRFFHDTGNLYIAVTTTDSDIKNKILWFGFTVWLDTENRRANSMGFSFPVEKRSEIAPQTGSKPYIPFNSTTPDLISSVSGQGYIDLIGFYGSSTRRVQMRDSRIKVKTEIIDDTLRYLAVVPFELLGDQYNPVLNNQILSIGLETGKYVRPPLNLRQRSAPAGGYPGGRLPGGATQQGLSPSLMPQGQNILPFPFDPERLTRSTRLWIDVNF